MQIHGAATLGFAKFDLDTSVKNLSSLGFKNVELSYQGTHSKHFPYKQVEPQTVLEVLSKNGVKPISMNISTQRMDGDRPIHFDFANPVDAQEAVDQGQWYLQCAKEMDVRVVTLSTARRVLDDRWNTVMKPACAAFRRIAETAGELGIAVNLEVPHLFQIADTVDHTKAIFAEIDHPAVGATVDSSHWGISGYDPFEFFTWLGPRLRHVHLRDSSGADTKDEKQNLELTPGKGTVDFVKLRKALEHVQYEGRVTLDFEYKITDLETIHNEYRQGLAELKRCGWEMA